MMPHLSRFKGVYMQLRWTRFVLPLALAGVVAAGCIRTEYVYVSRDGAPVSNTGMMRVSEWRQDQPGHWQGKWTADLSDQQKGRPGQLQVEFTDGHATRTFVTQTSAGDLSDSPFLQAVTSDAGTLTFEGTRAGKSANGIVRFDANPDYAAEVKSLLGEPPSEDQYLELAMNRLQLVDIRRYHKAGPSLTLEDIQRLRNNSVGADDVADLAAAGYALTVDELIRLRNSGISSTYAIDLRKGGLKLDASQLVKLHNSGIDAAYAVGMYKIGLGEDIDTIISLHNSGINVDYVNSFSKAGYKFDKESLIHLHNSGINSDYAASLKQGGYELGEADIIRLHNSGINSDYAAGLKKAGYTLDVKDIIRLHNAGVNVDYVAAMTTPNKNNLTVDQIINLRNRGVDAETVRKLRE